MQAGVQVLRELASALLTLLSGMQDAMFPLGEFEVQGQTSVN